MLFARGKSFIEIYQFMTKLIQIFYSYLLPDKNRGSKQKTAVIKRTTNPQWYESFIKSSRKLFIHKLSSLKRTNP